MKQLMSYDPGEWTESLRKEYVLVIEGFFTLPFPLFSTTYRRAIQVINTENFYLLFFVCLPGKSRRKIIARIENDIFCGYFSFHFHVNIIT